MYVRAEIEESWWFSNVTGYRLVVLDLIFIGGFGIYFCCNIDNTFLSSWNFIEDGYLNFSLGV
jgi:hypothetical protein